jgi:RNA polymerase sigma-70 factor (ECF subfamily)
MVSAALWTIPMPRIPWMSAVRTAPAEREVSDQQLVARCQAGDPSGLTALVERYQQDVFGTCLRLTHDANAALELTNAIFYKAYQNLHSYDPARPLRPWLLRIATNETLNYLRGQRRDREHTVQGEEGESLTERLAGPDDPAAAVLAAERGAAVRAAVARLPEHYRLLIVLRFFHDLSYAEIAEQTNIPINTIGVQLSRARALLRRALAGQEITDADPS